MEKAKTIDFIVNWLNAYCEQSKMKGFVVGISGGIDSALTSTLCAKTGKPTLCLNMPIKQHQAELSKMRQMFDDQIKEMKMDLRFAGIKNYGDDGSVSGNTNNANQSRSTDLIIAGSIIGVLGVIGLSLVAMSHSKS